MIGRKLPEQLADFLDGMGTAARVIDRNLGDDIRYVAKLLPVLPHALPTKGMCPYCAEMFLLGHWRPELRGTYEMVAYTTRVVKRICANSDEYRCGYRALWRCDNCGELELR